MSVFALSQKARNRRVALRIYEPVNLYYQKLPVGSTEPLTEQALRQAGDELPKSESQENDTRNANISASGIAFTAQDALVRGDVLRLRILLLSSMTVLTTCARVVYCRSSNPYEDDRLPYTIGAEFINMSAEETALLDAHVQRHRRRQRMANAGYAALIMAVLIAPDYALHLLMELLHHVFTEVLHLLHLVFEYLEMGLDHVIEHQFHTDRHETQVIVFYTLVVSGLILLSLQLRRLKVWLINRCRAFAQFMARKKSSAQYEWAGLSGLDKCKVASIAAMTLGSYGYFLML